MNFRDVLEDNPIIAAVKDFDSLNKALESDVQIIFVLFGNIMNITEISEKIHLNRKLGILHIDLVEGLANKEVSIAFVKANTKFKGIISTKPQIVKAAKNYGLVSIQRCFILDTISLKNVNNHLAEECDAVEMLPGLLYKIISRVSKSINKPLIAGGLIEDKEDVVQALKSGASCVSTSKQDIWSM